MRGNAVHLLLKVRSSVTELSDTEVSVEERVFITG